MSFQGQIRQHLEKSGQSQRALSMQAGLNPKAVSDILNRPGHRPTRETLCALGGAMGIDLDTPPKRMTYAALIAELSCPSGDEAEDHRKTVLASRLRKVVRAAGWVPETEKVDRRRLVECFDRWSPATLNLSPGSFATYKSDVLSAIDIGCGRSRKEGICDIEGYYRALHEAVAASDMPQDLKLIAGAFFFYLDRAGLRPGQITSQTLRDYYDHRITVSGKSEQTCRKHVKRIANLCSQLAADTRFSDYRFPAVPHPFEDGRDKYGVPTSMFAGFLDEFDGPVSRWVRGETSREGLSYEDFLAQLDAAAPGRNPTGKMALLKPKRGARKRTDEERRSAGFLIDDETWSDSTLANRRGILIAGAKALYASTGYGIESVFEYTNPQVVEGVLEAVRAGNSGGEFPSGYAETVGKTLKKLARDYVGCSESEVKEIVSTISDYASGSKGIAKRNKAKLREIIGDRQQRLIDAGDILINEVNCELDRRARRSRGTRRLDLMDVDLARDVMCAVASDILLARAPRKENVRSIQLAWISWQGDLARITVPNVEVKMRDAGDPDLVIPLGANESRRLRLYLDKVRSKALRPGDEANPFLFPAQGASVPVGRPYVGLLERLMRHTNRIVGLRMNPHLYRHFLGWLWLKEDPDRLPDVQRLLGHTSLETTLQHYAEIDEDLALQRWQDFLSDKKSRRPKNFERKAKP